MKVKARRRRKPSGLAKSFDINIQPWDGIITSQDAYTIPEDTAQWISGLPKLTGAIENVKDVSTVYTHTAAIYYAFGFELSGTRYYCILDGSNLVFLSAGFEVIASFSTTRTVCDYAIQDGAYIWVTTRDFLITFNGSTIYNLTNYNIKGDSIAYWKGKIFIAKDRVVTFSVPNPDATGQENPFDTSRGAGFLTVTVSDFNRIVALVPKEDSIFLFTDRSIVVLAGTALTADPATWYLTEAVKGLGTTGIRKYVVYEHVIFFHTFTGIYEIVAIAPNKVDDAITNMTGEIYGMAVANYLQVPYIFVVAKSFLTGQKAIYCYNLLFKKWYALDVYADGIFHVVTDTFIFSGNRIQKMFASNEYIPLSIKSKVYFNVDNVYFNIKDIVIYGRGSSHYLSSEFGESKSVIQALQFTSSDSTVVFQLQAGQLISFIQDAGFWIAVFKPRQTSPHSMRVKQFQLDLKQQSKFYSEIINIKIRGTLGARYV